MSKTILTLLLPGLLLAGVVDTAWVRRYDGPRHGQDWATCLQVDSSGNVYVAGPSAADTGYADLDYVVIKYRANGDLAWLRRRDIGGDDLPAAMAVDGRGNVYVTGVGAGRTATIKYDSIGRLVWLRTIGTQGAGNDLVLDGAGNVLLCGATFRGQYECVTAKYRPNGETAWVRFFADGGNALSTGPTGCVAVVGSYLDSVPRAHCLAFKYDSVGELLWVTRYVGSAEAEYLDYVAVDSWGSVIAAGSSIGEVTGLDYLTIKYSSQGETLWTRRYNGSANDRDEARALAVDWEGNVYVTGHSYNFPVSSDDYATIKYDAFGSEVWVRRYDSPYNDADAAYDLALDSAGNVYVTGRSRVATGMRYDYLTIKYSSQGDTLWTCRYDGPTHDNDAARCVVVDGQGNVYVAGSSEMGPGQLDIVTIKYVQSGAVVEGPAAPQVLPVLMVEPNPCRGRAVLTYIVGAEVRVGLVVRDVTGRRVRVMAEGRQPAGRHTLVWDLCDAAGCRVPAGVYLVELAANGRRSRLKIQVLD
uniref:FlgD/Vpr Ig-like domain-containing protein n=1 Tax=candidate division WOR-3 bacterium TaxID=2052148 RepID=A0A7C4GGS0_UNCW3